MSSLSTNPTVLYTKEWFSRKYVKMFKELSILCNQAGYGDPFQHSRGKEIYTAILLGHQISNTMAGADGIDEDGECEYKSTSHKNINGVYCGISIQKTEQEQIDYINNDKVGKYTNHYFLRFENNVPVECWKLKGKKVAEILMPKIIKQYNRKPKSTKDPRIRGIITKTEIYKYGERII